MAPFVVVINPNAYKNRHRSSEWFRSLTERVGNRGMVRRTESLDDVADVVRESLDADARCFLADGGDGTLNCLIHELRRARAERGSSPDALPPMIPTNSGTIDAVARKARIRGSTDQLVDALLADPSGPPETTVDSLRLVGETTTGEPLDRIGFALAAGGVGKRFFDKYYAEKRQGSGAIVRVVLKAVASHLAGRDHPTLGSYAAHVFAPTRAHVTLDSERLEADEHGAIHAGAFDLTLGVVFRVFPLAREPGLVHFQAGPMTPLEMMRALPRLATGRLVGGRSLVERAGREMVVEPLDEPLEPVLDGEPLPPLRRLTVSLGPRLRVGVPRT